MTRREFLKTGAILSSTLAVGNYSLFPLDVYAKLPANLTVTALKVIPVFNGSYTWVYVKIYTSEGITGIGEGGMRGKEGTMIAAIQEHERYLIGKNPLEIEKHWQAMYRWARWRGGPILNTAISAVEMALWDIAGKVIEAPIYQLLGGAAREKIRIYMHGGGATPQEAAEAIHRAKELGLTALKTAPRVARNSVVHQPWDIDYEISLIRAMRDAAGKDFDILIDAHTMLTPLMALEYALRLEELRPFFLEEPVEWEDLDTLAWLSNKVKIPLAMGERQFTKFGFKEMIDRHLVSYVQPDVKHAGGISECKKIAAMAEAHFIDTALHNDQSPVMTLASLHIDACTPNCVIQEFPVHKYEPWMEELFGGVHIKYSNGFAELPPGPGLGIDINEEEAKKHPYHPVNREMWEWEDGSVADL